MPTFSLRTVSFIQAVRSSFLAISYVARELLIKQLMPTEALDPFGAVPERLASSQRYRCWGMR